MNKWITIRELQQPERARDGIFKREPLSLLKRDTLGLPRWGEVYSGARASGLGSMRVKEAIRPIRLVQDQVIAAYVSPRP